MDSSWNFVGHLLLGKRLETKCLILTCVTIPTKKSESHLQSVMGRLSW